MNRDAMAGCLIVVCAVLVTAALFGVGFGIGWRLVS